jgi:hypothetical protein
MAVKRRCLGTQKLTIYEKFTQKKAIFCAERNGGKSRNNGTLE